MSGRNLSNGQILTLLTATPTRIAKLTDCLAPEQLMAAPNPGEWSANEVLAHLRSCADVWGSCIAVLISEDAPTLRAVNPRTWIEKTDYRQQKFLTSLQAFTAQRVELLGVLEPLAPEGWSRSAIVTGAGKPLERTVYFYAQWLAIHERPHIKQIERIANTMRLL